jgi:hypothetical protein
VEVADRCLYAAKLSGRDGWVGLLGRCATADAVGAFLGTPADPEAREGLGLATSFQDAESLRWS